MLVHGGAYSRKVFIVFMEGIQRRAEMEGIHGRH